MKQMISRRSFLRILGITGGMLAAGTACAYTPPNPNAAPAPGQAGEIVTVAEGQLQGTVNEGVYRYLGVPYGEAKERFVPAGPVTPWEGVRAADGFADAGKDIPFLIGSNLNEWTGFFRTSTKGVDAAALSAALKAAYPDKTDLTADHVDTLIRLPLLKTMAHKADQNGAPVYAYLMTYGNSAHGAEIPYIFRQSDSAAMNDLFSSVWVNFARNGVPAAEGLPAWEPYTRESGATMLLDMTSQLVYHHDEALLKLLAPEYQY